MKKIILILVVLIAIPIAWWLLSPLFVDKVVDEELGFAFDPEIIDFETLTEEKIAQMSPEEKVMAENMLLEKSKGMSDVVMDEDSPMPAEEIIQEVADIPVVVSKGVFAGSDSFHQGAGDALVISSGDGNVVRFEDFSVTNGPDLRVLLSKEVDPNTTGAVGEYIELGKLKGNVGNQNYVVPVGTDMSQYNSVIIYCKPFHVMFAAATL